MEHRFFSFFFYEFHLVERNFNTLAEMKLFLHSLINREVVPVTQIICHKFIYVTGAPPYFKQIDTNFESRTSLGIR